MAEADRLCPVCGLKPTQRGSRGRAVCWDCFKREREEDRVEGVPQDLLDMRWVKENVGSEAKGTRKFWADFYERNQREFLAELREAESQWAASQKPKDQAEGQEDEGIERAIELAEKWLEENEGGRK